MLGVALHVVRGGVMAWCKLEDTFRDHRKPKRLARVLGVRRAEARGLVVALWSWCVTNAPDGKLTDLADYEIEEAADWEGTQGAFVQAALDVEIISGEAYCREVVGFLERAESFRKARKVATRREQERNAANEDADSVQRVFGTQAEHVPDVSTTKPAERRGEEKRGDPDLALAPNLSPATPPIFDPRSSVSSESKKDLALSASPSAAADALHVLDVKPPKRKERSPEQKKRSVNNAHLYRDLYEQAEGHQPAGLDQAFYGAMAKFSDKYGDDAQHIIAWAFQCPDKSFRAKGWPLPLIIEQAPRLWRELNDPNKAIANIAAPRQQQQLALAAANEMAFTEFLARHGEVPNATR